MLVIPAIDLMDGKCVQLVEGKPWSAKVVIDDAVGVALRWQNMGAKRLHVIDLDAALGNGSNEQIVRDIISKAKIPVQVGGGIRSESKADQMLSAGAAQVIVGTKAIEDSDWLSDMASTYPERIMVAVDARGREISIKGWTDGSGIKVIDYVKSVEPLPLFGLLYTNINVEGKLKGIDIRPVQELVSTTKKRLFVAGGIASLDDVEKLKSAGAFAAVLGMAIYKGKINLKDALERFK